VVAPLKPQPPDSRSKPTSGIANAADVVLVQLTQCPYDSTPIEAEVVAGGSFLLSCTCCGAKWEWHGAWVHRINEPDREAVREARAASETAGERATERTTNATG
jgi:hypothetical protein